MPVRPKGGNHQKYGHAGKKKHTGVEVFLFIFEKAVKHCRGNIGKPEKIRDYKDFQERNPVVYLHMNNEGGIDNLLFKPCKPDTINHGINHQRNRMFIPLIKIFHNIAASH
jgi:hypothetical protein